MKVYEVVSEKLSKSLYVDVVSLLPLLLQRVSRVMYQYLISLKRGLSNACELGSFFDDRHRKVRRNLNLKTQLAWLFTRILLGMFKVLALVEDWDFSVCGCVLEVCLGYAR